MKKNQTILIFAALILTGSVIACSMFGGSNSNGNTNSNGNSMSNTNIASSTPRPAADCPTTTFSVSELKDSLAKYEGCTLSIRGKLWEVRPEYVTLIDTFERTDYNGSISCGGSFSGSTYSDIGFKISNMKINQQYDKLPTATFTGTVKTVDGYNRAEKLRLDERAKITFS